MAVQYRDNPLLFVNSSGSSVPDGRNVRTLSRTLQAAALQAVVTKDSVHFEVLNFKRKRSKDADGTKATRKSQKKIRQANSQKSLHPPLIRNVPDLIVHEIEPRALSISKILTVATFHIRRVASMTLCRNPERLVEVLRCRQWSYVSIGEERVDYCPCLRMALICVKMKLRQITGRPTSPIAVLSKYTGALQSLQAALQERQKYESDDLLVTTQLLAVYEMLDSIENEAWRQHLTGAQSFTLLTNGSLPVECVEKPFSPNAVVPMVTDALLSGNSQFLKSFNWRTPLHSHIDRFDADLAPYLSQVPDLLIDAHLNTKGAMPDPRTAFNILDRAHVLKAHLCTELSKDHVRAYDAHGQGESFDKLGFYLAAVLSLDQIITSLRPVQIRSRDTIGENTEELCTKLLNLELRAAEEYPPVALLSAFQLSAP